MMRSGLLTAAVLTLALVAAPAAAQDMWRGIPVAPEHRCSDYDLDDYLPPQSVEQEIVASMGGIVYGPYTGRVFASTDETDIELIVAISEAHDSGLCAADVETRRAFSRDLLNLTLASPEVNSAKWDHDAAEWLPALNRCWFAGRIVEVRRKYGLTIDRREADALEAVLSGCISTEMVMANGAASLAPSQAETSVPAGVDDLLNIKPPDPCDWIVPPIHCYE